MKNIILLILLLLPIGVIAQPNGIEVGWVKKTFEKKFSNYKWEQQDDSTIYVRRVKWLASTGDLIVNFNSDSSVRSWSWIITELASGKNALTKLAGQLDKKYGNRVKLYDNEDKLYWINKTTRIVFNFEDPESMIFTAILRPQL